MYVLKSGDPRGRLWPALILMILLSGCQTVEPPLDASSVYRSVWAEMYPDTLLKEPDVGSLQGAFRYAAASANQETAERRWKQFLDAWAPGNGEFEDGMHANLVTWAQLELERLQNLNQDKHAAAEAVHNRLRELAAGFE